MWFQQRVSVTTVHSPGYSLYLWIANRVFTGVLALLTLRFALDFVGLNDNHFLASLVRTITDVFMLPFRWLFPLHLQGMDAGVLGIMMIYALLFLASRVLVRQRAEQTA